MVSLTTPVCDFGWKAPDFDLPGTDGRRHSLASARGPNGLLVMFICNHCPYVRHVRGAVAALAREYAERGVAAVASHTLILSEADVKAHCAANLTNYKRPRYIEFRSELPKSTLSRFPSSASVASMKPIPDAPAKGWVVIDMAKDWKTVFAD